MKIDGNGRIGGPAAPGARRGARAGEGGFKLGDTEETAAGSSLSGAGPVGGIGALFALQEVDADGERRRAAKRGNDLLDQLEDLKLGLLFGHFPKEKLQNLLVMVRSRQEKIGDPRLAGVLADIELRAEVELAKLGF